jgi:hypothetical protein
VLFRLAGEGCDRRRILSWQSGPGSGAQSIARRTGIRRRRSAA